MKPQIKKPVRFGSGSHIIMEKEDLGKRFLVLPESSKYILGDILRKYHENLKELTDPLLGNFFSKTEFEVVKKIYKQFIEEKSIQKGLFVKIHKKFLESSYKNLNEFRLSDIDRILWDIEDKLPEKLKNKMLAEWGKING